MIQRLLVNREQIVDLKNVCWQMEVLLQNAGLRGVGALRGQPTVAGEAPGAEDQAETIDRPSGLLQNLGFVNEILFNTKFN